MPKGTWSEKNKPTLAGIYNRFLTKAKETITGGTHGVLGMPVKANWGEIGKVIEVNSFADLAEIFGKDSTYSAYKLGRLAFLGKPEKLLLYRVADDSAAYGTVSLQNIESKDAITLKTNLVTFSGPTFKSLTSWETDYGFKEVIKRFIDKNLNLGVSEDKYETLHEGIATGKLIGGNLTLTTQMVCGRYSLDFAFS